MNSLYMIFLKMGLGFQLFCWCLWETVSCRPEWRCLGLLCIPEGRSAHPPSCGDMYITCMHTVPGSVCFYVEIFIAVPRVNGGFPLPYHLPSTLWNHVYQWLKEGNTETGWLRSDTLLVSILQHLWPLILVEHSITHNSASVVRWIHQRLMSI